MPSTPLATPFSRIRTRSADITFDEARAKGYVKGASRRKSSSASLSEPMTPTTIYKKQKLDRDDVPDNGLRCCLDEGEMRLMLEEGNRSRGR